MDLLKTLLVANRGEISVRIIKTAKSLNIKTISIYTKSDAGSHHVRAADEAVLLPGPDLSAYTDGDAIIKIAKEKRADAIIPGYGFLSENADFARGVKEAGIVWVGPSPEAIEAFGVKHVARQLAEKSGIPIVPGTKGLVESADDAVEAASALGFPVMLKSTAGGGGMGLVVCNTEEEVKKGFETVASRGKTLFKNPGLFIEKYFPESRHIEVQVFGNGNGKAIHFGERECSIQRRHQKVIEECPSPFVARYPGLRQALGEAACRLAESVKYGSAGTVEYLLDDKTGGCFFLEMNTRLQVEHGITELCYGVDLVELMLEQADAELSGKVGLDASYLGSLQNSHSEPKGAAIEARVYAENPVRNYVPSPGVLQEVVWAEGAGTRVDTWVSRGSTISPNYDPLIAKVMFHSIKDREDAVLGMQSLLTHSVISGPPNNLDFLSAIVDGDDFTSGQTLTSLLHSFEFAPPAIDVLSGGAYTLIQDYPGRPSVGKGIPHSGAMDPVAFQIANVLVGNHPGTEGLEITLSGPDLRFIRPAIVALCGAPMETTLDGNSFPMWTRVRIGAGQKLKIGKCSGGGCRSYLAVYGGFPSVAEYFGSKSTSPLVGIGGYQGRALAAGDLLAITDKVPEDVEVNVSLPARLIPKYSNEWEIMAMVGPHDEGYLLPEDIDMIYDTEWKVSHNASRSGIRLVGPVPRWARKDGGEGGSHPSNVIEYGYPIAALNWTGDDPCIFPIDCPNFGGFVSSTTIVHADWSKMGQIKAGDKLKYRRISFEEAVAATKLVNDFVDDIEAALNGKYLFAGIQELNTLSAVSSSKPEQWGKAVVAQIPSSMHQPLVTYRQGGDRHLIVEYGSENFDLNHRCRVTALEKLLRDPSASPEAIIAGLITTVGCCTSITISFDPLTVSRTSLLEHLQALESRLGDVSTMTVPTRRFRLPITFESAAQDRATKRYMETQRPHAPYLPDNLRFVAENNAFTPERLKEIYLTGEMATVVVGFFCGNAVSLPVDPRMRMSCPKANPSRVETPAGTVGWGGSCMSIYPVTSPGGYQMTGRTVPIFDLYGTRPGFSLSKPWLFQDFDLLTFYQVSEAEMDAILAAWEAGKYGWEWEEVVFDMGAHNQLLRATRAEVEGIRARQAEAQAKMLKAEEESLAKWREERAWERVDDGAVERLLAEDGVEAVEAPVDANVWKVLVSEGQEVQKGKEVVVLEAMKLEMAVEVPEGFGGGKMKVEKVLVKPGETVTAGAKIVLLRVVDKD